MAEYEGTKEESILEPQVVATPSTQKLSLTASGTQDSGISGEKSVPFTPSEGLETSTTAFSLAIRSKDSEARFATAAEPFSAANVLSSPIVRHMV